MKDNFVFKTIRRKLTLLCTGITVSILIAMSFTYLHISEASLQSNHFLSFKDSMSSFIYNLEQQTVITHDWLLATQSNGGFFVQIKDNGEDLLFNTRAEKEKRQELFDYAKAAGSEDSEVPQQGSPGTSRHFEFKFKYDNNLYYGCTAKLYKNNGSLDIIAVTSVSPLTRQINRQRLLFIIVNLSAAAALFIFAYFFTGKLLKPIEENQRNQNQFIAAASHELRTPLAAMLSCACACQKADSNQKDGFLATIQSEGMRMSRLINDMLTLSKTDNHTFDIEKAEWEPDTLLLNTYEAFEQMAKQKSITLTVSLPEEASVPCLLDRERIMQVLSILVDNALSYTPYKGHVTLSMELKDSLIIYSIADNGIGIPKEERENIFKRFYRIDKARNQKEHFGLGLSIALEIVSAHQGSLLVTDTPDGGSTFIVQIPV